MKFLSLVFSMFILGGAAQVKANSTSSEFHNLNGVMWFYTTRDNQKFSDITKQLAALRHQGIRVIGIYSPYHGDQKKWFGCAPLDFYNVSPQSGTLEDWRELVEQAHQNGMKVVSYFVNIYIDRDSEFFKTAERQYAAGDFHSREVSSFHWTKNHKDVLPNPAAGPSSWKYSATAKAYYWSLWDEAGFDFNLPGARAEVERFTKFWLDTGLDGFMWDAAVLHPTFKPLMVDLPLNYTQNEKWLTFESTWSEEAKKFDNFGLTTWFNFEDNDTENAYFLITHGKFNGDDLEELLQANDYALAQGKMTHAWTLQADEENNPYPNEELMRLQEAALLAGAGITYGAPDYGALKKWPQKLQNDWLRVLSVVNDNPALLPSASRKRLNAGKDAKAFAMIRTSADNSQSVLLLYNFRNKPMKFDVDLKNMGIQLQQSPVNLYSGGSAKPVLSYTYQVDLPAYGFQILQIERDGSSESTYDLGFGM